MEGPAHGVDSPPARRRLLTTVGMKPCGPSRLAALLQPQWTSCLAAQPRAGLLGQPTASACAPELALRLQLGLPRGEEASAGRPRVPSCTCSGGADGQGSAGWLPFCPCVVFCLACPVSLPPWGHLVTFVIHDAQITNLDPVPCVVKDPPATHQLTAGYGHGSSLRGGNEELFQSGRRACASTSREAA